MYLRGFAFSLQELLVDYGNNLREIEKQYMQDNSLSLLYLYQKTQKYRILLPYLHELVDRLKNKKGGEIIEIVYSCSTNGDPIISKEINKFLNSLLKILYTQIGSWIVYGYIDDNYQYKFLLLLLLYLVSILYNMKKVMIPQIIIIEAIILQVVRMK